jgi:hypothetical protein
MGCVWGLYGPCAWGRLNPETKYVFLLFFPPNMVSEPEVSSSNPGGCDLLK